MKEKEAEINYIWVCSEIGKIKREIQEKERLLLLLQKNKILFELRFIKDRKKRK